jgi:hypothetical protein
MKRKSLAYWANAVVELPEAGSLEEAASSARWALRVGKKPDLVSLASRSREWQDEYWLVYTAG